MKKRLLILLVFIILLSPSSIMAEENVLDDNIEETPKNGLPLVVIRVDEEETSINSAKENDPDHEYGDISAINESTNHSVRGIGTVEIILPNNYVSEYGSLTIPEGEKKLEYIRGRGNSTWLADKKPYKFKYDKKQDILGMGANKEWALLANYMDRTLTNNAIAMKINQEFGMEYPIQMVPVEVVMIGSKSGRKFLGSYYLTELVDIGSGRIEIPELKKKEEENITGGYLVSLYYESQDYDKPKSTIFKTDSGLEFMNENPSFDSENLTIGQIKQRDYIRNYINEIDKLIVNNDVIDEEVHNKIGELMDFKSTADYWLLQEFLINFDAYKTSSNYLYKKPNGKLYWGPIWDFDLMYYWVDRDNPEEAIGFSNYNPNVWLDSLREKDPIFVELLKERWKVLEPILINITKEGGVLDEYKERQRDSWIINYDMWMRDFFYGELDYDEEFEKTRNLIDFRRKWFNENIDKIGDVNYTISYEVDGKIVKNESFRAYQGIAELNYTPKKEGLYFKEWVDKETNESILYKKLEKDKTLIPIFIDPNDIEEKTLFLSSYEAWADINDEIYEGIYPKILPEDDNTEILKYNLKWTSSNKNIATVENGTVYLNSVGDVTITASLNDGTSQSYLLHIYDENQDKVKEPNDIILEKEYFELEVGDIDQIVYKFTPNKPFEDIFWVQREVSDEEIIEVDYNDCFTITALKEGTSTITLKLYNYSSDEVISTKIVEVLVKPKSKDIKVIPKDNSQTNVVATKEVKKLIKEINEGKTVEGITSELANKIRSAIEEDKEIKIDVSINKINESQIKEDANKIRKKLNNNAKILDFYDININIIIDNKIEGKVEKLDNKITIYLDKPNDLPNIKEGYKRVFSILKLHNGYTTTIELTESDNLLYFETDEFSIYALTYEDIKIQNNNPKTNDNITNYLLILIVSVLNIISLIIYTRRSKNEE